MKKSFILLLSIVFFAWSCQESEDASAINIGGVEVQASYDNSRGLQAVANITDFTGMWCGFCPYASVDSDKFHEDNPDQFTVLAFHSTGGYGASADLFEVPSIIDHYQDAFSITGFPSVFGNYATRRVGPDASDSYLSTFESLLSNMDSPAEAGVALDASVSGEDATYVLSFAGTANTEYKYIAFKTTNGHKQRQRNYYGSLGGDYLEDFSLNFVVEEVLSDKDGTSFTTDESGMFRTEANNVSVSTIFDGVSSSTDPIDTYITVIVLDDSDDYVTSRSVKISGSTNIHAGFLYVQ